MAVTYGFFNSVNGDRKYDADQMSEFYNGIVTEGVFQHIDNGLAVTAGTGMTVTVATGRAIIQNKWVKNDAILTLDVGAASSVAERVDAVVIRFNSANRNVSIVVKEGGADAPDMTRSGGIYEMALAYINIQPGATTVSVVDKRSDSSVCGWAAVAQAASGEVDQMLDDLKTGYDGTTYSTPAAEVQGSDQKLQNQINKVYSIPAVQIITGYVEHKGIATDGAIVYPSYYIDAQSMKCVVVNASEGDVFTVNGSGGGQLRLWCFIDANNNVISVASKNVEVKDLILVAPANSSKLIINNLMTDIDSYIGKVSSIKQITDCMDDPGNIFTQYYRNKYPINNGWPGNDSWTFAPDANHMVVPAKAGHHYEISAQVGSGCYYYLCKDYQKPTSGSSPVNFCDSFVSRVLIPLNTTAQIVAPYDCKYFVFSNRNFDSSQDLSPLYVKDITDNVELLNNHIKSGEIDLYAYGADPGHMYQDRWINVYNAKHFVVPIKSGAKLTIKTGSNGTYYQFLADYTRPTSEDQNFISTGSRELVSANSEESVIAPIGTNYVVISENSGGQSPADLRPKNVYITYEDTISELYDKLSGVKSITFDTPIEILSNKDEDATALDSKAINYFNIIQQSENMFYMYYTGIVDPAQDYGEVLLFAYSTDGINYTRGFPQGVEAPFPGTNRYFSSDTTDNALQPIVFKCLDPIYPYRLIVQQKVDATHYVNMYKSADGINFDHATVRTLQYEYHDTQYGAVCRGNVIKLFSRTNKNYYVNGVSHHSREISVLYFDLDGNKLSPSKDLPLRYVYDNAASAISDHQEIIIPTTFDNTEVGGVKDESFDANVYLVDGYGVEPVASNVDDVYTSDDKWSLFVPTLLTVHGDQYLAFYTSNQTHDGFVDDGTRINKYKIVKVTMNF